MSRRNRPIRNLRQMNQSVNSNQAVADSSTESVPSVVYFDRVRDSVHDDIERRRIANDPYEQALARSRRARLRVNRPIRTVSPDPYEQKEQLSPTSLNSSSPHVPFRQSNRRRNIHFINDDIPLLEPDTSPDPIIINAQQRPQRPPSVIHIAESSTETPSPISLPPIVSNQPQYLNQSEQQLLNRIIPTAPLRRSSLRTVSLRQRLAQNPRRGSRILPQFINEALQQEPYWHCIKCGHKNFKTQTSNCVECGLEDIDDSRLVRPFKLINRPNQTDPDRFALFEVSWKADFTGEINYQDLIAFEWPSVEKKNLRADEFSEVRGNQHYSGLAQIPYINKSISAYLGEDVTVLDITFKRDFNTYEQIKGLKTVLIDFEVHSDAGQSGPISLE